MSFARDMVRFHLKGLKFSSWQAFKVSVGNDLAFLDQKTGAIVPFAWTASFDDIRK